MITRAANSAKLLNSINRRFYYVRIDSGIGDSDFYSVFGKKVSFLPQKQLLMYLLYDDDSTRDPIKCEVESFRKHPKTAKDKCPLLEWTSLQNKYSSRKDLFQTWNSSI